jgi:hypothetical protein
MIAGVEHRTRQLHVKGIFLVCGACAQTRLLELTIEISPRAHWGRAQLKHFRVVQRF